MSKQEILRIINSKFPGSIGVILTGSQANKSQFDISRDIDIVLLTSTTSVVSTIIMTIGDYKFDITLVPLYDIENVLLNEKFDLRGSFLSLIAHGKILTDSSQTIFSTIKDKANYLYNKQNHFVTREQNDATIRLNRIKGELSRDCDEMQLFILYNEVIHLLLHLEVLHYANWLYVSKYKVRFLYENSPVFLNKLMHQMDTRASESCSSKKARIINFVDYYLTGYERKHPGKESFSNRCMFDIACSTITIENFIHDILPRILDNPGLKDDYLYFYSTPKSYPRICKHGLCLVFHTGENKTEEAIYAILKPFLEIVTGKSVEIGTNGKYLYSDINRNVQSSILFERVAIEINALNVVQIRHKTFGHERSTLIATFLFSYVFHYLNFQVNDFMKVAAYLFQRYIFNFGEQMTCKSITDFENLKRDKIRLFRAYYKENNTFINTLLGRVRAQVLAPDETKEYALVVVELKKYIDEQRLMTGEIIEKNLLTYSVLMHNCNIDEVDKALLYIITFEHLIRSLHIDGRQICLSLYAMNETILEKMTRQESA